MYGILYEIDPSGGDPIYLTQTDDYILDSTDIDNWISIGFQNNYLDLMPGTQYLPVIGGYALIPSDIFGINTSNAAEPVTCHIQDNGCNIGSRRFWIFWYWINDIPMIRKQFWSN